MQIFKNTLLACSLIVAVSPIYLQAEDNAAQAAARAALQQKMQELNGTSSEQPAAPVVVPPKPAQPAAVAPAAPTPPSAPVAPAPTISKPTGASPDLIEQAREATRARLRELQNNPATSIPAGQESPAPQAKPAEVAPGYEPYVPAKNSKEEAREMKNQEKQSAVEAPADAKAMARKEKEEAKARADAEKAAAKQAEKEAKKHKGIETMPTFSPLEAPASSLPASKEQRLQALTEKYKADQISAEEYHEQRSKILAEP